jgi:hypothetical protein
VHDATILGHIRMRAPGCDCSAATRSTSKDSPRSRSSFISAGTWCANGERDANPRPRAEPKVPRSYANH